MPEWLKDAAFYEVYPQTFYDTNGDGIGDIDGIAEKLDYIKGLGCNAVWINPCFDSPFKDAGYDVRNYKLVAPRYGTNEDLYKLFKAAHSKGIKIILDLVPGHTSEDHEWFLKSKQPAKNEYSNRYIWTNSIWDAPMNYRCIGGRCDRDGNYIVNFFSVQPALNYGFNKITADWQLPYTHRDCIATREAMKDVMRFWLDKGCDGFRVDMADSLVKNDDDKSATGEIWLDVRKMFDKDYPEAALVSEWSYPQLALKYGFHADFYLDHNGNGYHELFRKKDENNNQISFFSKLGKGDIRQFTEPYLERYNGSKKYGYMSFITCNHDTPRMRRDFDESELKLAYAFIFTMPGVPFLYYGDEIGMRYIEGLVSKEGGYSRTGTRTPMQWNDEKNYGFSTAPKDKLYLPVDESADAPTVESQSRCKGSLLNTVKDVIKLRHENECLKADGDFEVLYAESRKYPFVYRRGDLIIGVNPSLNKVTAPVNVKGDIIYAIGDKAEIGASEIVMAPQSFAVIKMRR